MSHSVFTSELIFINTLPKSGSVYILNTLCKGLSRNFCRISENKFPEDNIVEEKLIKFINSNNITQEHINASSRNIELLKRYGVELILHVRDPRQAVLSWTHHLLHYWKVGSLGDQYRPLGYYTWSFEKQLDHQIQVHFPDLVQWITDWLSVYKEGKLNMKMLTYEYFHQNEYLYFEEVLDFFHIPISSFQCSRIPLTMGTHFRRGEIDEWRRVMTLEQQERITVMMPDEFFSFFSWER